MSKYCAGCSHFKEINGLDSYLKYHCEYHKEKARITDPLWQVCEEHLDILVIIRNNKIDEILNER